MNNNNSKFPLRQNNRNNRSFYNRGDRPFYNHNNRFRSNDDRTSENHRSNDNDHARRRPYNQYQHDRQFPRHRDQYQNRGQKRVYDDSPVPIKEGDGRLETLFETSILRVMKADGQPMSLGVLLNKVIADLKSNGERFYIEKGNIIYVLEKLVNSNTVGKNLRDKFYLDYQNFPEVPDSQFEGEFRMAVKGTYGFIVTKTSDQEVKYFVHKRNFNNALDNDRVQAVVLDTSSEPERVANNLRQDAKIINVIGHGKECYVGEVRVDSEIGVEANAYYALLDNAKINNRVKLINPQNLVTGHKVLIKLIKFEANALEGEVIRVLGHKDDVGVDIESIVYDHGIQIDFPTQVQKQADEIDHSFDRFWNQVHAGVRKDCTTLPFVTIDPATSKDFDDAIYIAKTTDHYVLKVAIADVTSYVDFDSELDKSAYDRGTSIYLVNSVIPMLPHVLSNDLCSLNPELVRCAMVCEMKINFNGIIDFNSASVYPALIKSHCRFNYDEVNAYFKNEQPLLASKAVVSDDVKQVIDLSHELFFLMEKEKVARGYINFDIPESKIVADDKNVPVEVKFYERYHAQMLIENCMVAANEAVTYFANNKKHKIPFIYRVHEHPKLDSLERFALQTKRLNFTVTTKIDSNITPRDIASWIAANPDNPYNELIHMMLLQCMAKAFYAAENLHHFGLASRHYTHFTSPIRRYPDMIVHRLFWMFMFNREGYSDQQRAAFKSKLKELTIHCSRSEMVAVETERAVNAYKFAEYMKQFIGQKYEVMVTSVNAKGCYVRLSNGIEGYALVARSDLDFFDFDPENFVLIGKRTNQKIALGSKLEVELIKTDLALRTIDFKIVQILTTP